MVVSFWGDSGPLYTFCKTPRSIPQLTQPANHNQVTLLEICKKYIIIYCLDFHETSKNSGLIFTKKIIFYSALIQLQVKRLKYF